MKIVTVSREFGSGGRELGKRVADRLGWAYYDREIITAIAEKSDMDEAYVARLLEQGVKSHYPLTFRHTFSYGAMAQQNTTRILIAQHKVMQELAARGEDCVIVGRGADVLLKEHNPMNLFVYADLEARMQRCRERAEAGEQLTDRELERKIKQVDNGRAKYRQLLTGAPWGRKESYHLCVNTTGQDIKALSGWIEGYVRYWFGGDGQ